MTSRQRVLDTLRRANTDRPPVFATLTPQIGERLAISLGMVPEAPIRSFFSNRISFTELLLRLGNDCVAIAATTPNSFRSVSLPDGGTVDEWGISGRPSGWYNEMTGHPLAHAETEQDVENFHFPDPTDPERFVLAAKMIQKYGEEFGIIAEQECTMFEISWYLVGLEKFLTDLVLNRSYVYALLDRIADYSIRQGSRLVELGADIIWAGDDMGNQNAMMISPELWRKVFKPRLARVFDRYRKINPGIRIAYHSCGSIRPIIPDLIEIGLDILNPIQPLASGMNAAELKREFGRDLVFFGGIDVQQVLPRGTPRDVKRHVREQSDILGKGGGYIVAPAHNIQPDTPLENILAMFEAVQEIGKIV